MSASLRPTLIKGNMYMFHKKDVEERLANHKRELLERFQGEHSNPQTQELREAYRQARKLVKKFKKVVKQSHAPTQEQWVAYCQSKKHPGSEEEFLCYTGRIKVAHLTEMFSQHPKEGGEAVDKGSLRVVPKDHGSWLEDRCHDLDQTRPVPALSYQRSSPKLSPGRDVMALNAGEQHPFPCVFGVQHPNTCDRRFRELRKHKHYIIDDGAWTAFEGGKWRDVYIPMNRQESVPHRNYRKIREAIFPKGLVSTALLESRLPPPHEPRPAKAQYLWHAPVPVPAFPPDQGLPPPQTAALPGVMGLTSGLRASAIGMALTTQASQGSLPGAPR
ncbi:hypothetical protein FPRO04_12461 [Fusarium proliferatum]|nr:hypothetical protein FPRO04_12461 [Fusarium proliferatum]